MLTVTSCCSECCVPSGLDFEPAGDSVVRGISRKSAHPPLLQTCKMLCPWALFRETMVYTWTVNEPLKKAGHWTGCILAVTRPHQLYWGDQVMGTATTCTQYSEVVPSNVYHADVIHWYCVWFLTQMICADSAYHRSGSFRGKNNLRFKFLAFTQQFRNVVRIRVFYFHAFNFRHLSN